MTAVASSPSRQPPARPGEPVETLADLVACLGSVPLERIRARPAPGTATEADVLAACESKMSMPCELVDGILVEKPMGFYESRLAAVLLMILGNFLKRQDLGIVVGESGMMRLAPGLVRIPDVSFLSWDRFPGRLLPAEPVPDLVPDLAVEVLSVTNTEAEMARKRQEYFRTGTRLVWMLDPRARTARVYTAPEQFTTVAEGQSLEGGDVLPGFSLPLAQWFADAGPQREPAGP